jgi:hypothetical protein
MDTSLRFALLAALGTATLSACAKPDASAQEVAAAIPQVSADGDPCALVSKGEVRAAFPGAESGKRDHAQDQYDIATCTWALPANTLAIQTFQSTNSVSDELRGRMLGYLDPLQPALREKIQYDMVSGLGDEALVVAVKADPAQGILAETAMLGIRRGEHMAVLFTARLVDGDPQASKQALQALAKGAASRL